MDSSWTYAASFFFKFPTSSSQSVKFTVELRSASGKIFASKSTTVSGTTTSWKQIQLSLKPTASAPDVNNQFVVLVQPSGSAATTVNFAMFSLFPPTFKGRANGMRMDIAEVRRAHATLLRRSDVIFIGTRRDGPEILPFPRRQ